MQKKGISKMKIKDILNEFKESERKEIEATVNECMKSICCEEVEWKEFCVYEICSELFKKMLQKLQISFLLPIAESARDEIKREVMIFCYITKQKEDRIYCVRSNSNKIHWMISLSKKTAKDLEKIE